MAPGPEPLVVFASGDGAAARAVEQLLRVRGFRVTAVADGRQLAAALAAEPPALLLLDTALEPDGGERFLADHPGLPVALVAERDSPAARETAVRRGAFDYLTWPPEPHRLLIALARAAERHRLIDQIRRLETALNGPAADEADGDLRAIDRLEKTAIRDALRRAAGNVRDAARLLGLGQATVYRKIKRYRLEIPGRRPPDRPREGNGLSPRLPDPARSGG